MEKFFGSQDHVTPNWLVQSGKGEKTVWSLYAQFSEDQDIVIKPQMSFV